LAEPFIDLEFNDKKKEVKAENLATWQLNIEI